MESQINKYREFRNYMVNELGITRQDIEAWTKQSVANEVEKLVKNINVDSLVHAAVEKYTGLAVTSYSSVGQSLQSQLAKEIAKNLTISVRQVAATSSERNNDATTK